MKMMLFIQCLLALMSCSNKQAKTNGMENIQEIQTQEYKDSYKLLHSFKAKDGTILGNAYALFGENQEVFTSMLITNEVNNKIDTLYKIDNTKLMSKKGVDTQVYEEGFFGYKCVLKKEDYLVLVLVDKYGEGISDNLTIEWNYEEDLFELMKAP